MSIEILVSKQNRDGGWPYVRGGSWTEPTVYAVMALLAAGRTEPAARGLRWILASRRSDGGWQPRPGVDQSTWVTALVALLPPEFLGAGVHARAIEWLLRTAGEESSLTYRLREWLIGNSPLPEQEFPGWPWFPGTAAWVGPTALAVLALERADQRVSSPRIRGRVEAGRRFLLTRTCDSGGWNHGSARDQSPPYPETTGMALAALRGVPKPRVEQSLAVARDFLGVCRSADARNWLRLGLLAHGQLEESDCPATGLEYRTLSELSVGLLVGEAQKGHNQFWG